jgi:inhibitor of cysteine peptidase
MIEEKGGVPMKLKLILLFVLLIPTFWIAACAPSSGTTSVNVACNDFNGQPDISKQLTVAAGSTFTVTLCSNPTTGFQWSESARIGDTSVIEQMSHEFVSPSNTEAVGVPGSEVWTFKALKKGTTTIHMDYSRPWEGGEKGTWTFDLTATVK